MPCISQFYGISIYVYYRDHAPPHVHARYSGQKVTLDVRSGSIVAGELAPRALRLVREWLALNEVRVVASWDEARRGLRPTPVPPLD